MSALITSAVAAPITVSSTRSSAYPGVVVPSASTSMPLIGIWFVEPGPSFSAQAISSDATIATRITQLSDPKSVPSTAASSTPRTTPTLRSMPLASDWFTLGCTTSSAAIAAKIGSGCESSSCESSHATTAAAEVFSTCSSGERFVSCRVPKSLTRSA